MKSVVICGGHGDFCLALPLVEQLSPCTFVTSRYHDSVGLGWLGRLLLPGVDLQFVDDCPDEQWPWPPSGGRTVVEDVARRWGVEPRYNLTDEAISRLSPKSGQYLILHPQPSEVSREWNFWKHLDFRGITVLMVGAGRRAYCPEATHVIGDFSETARLLRGAIGLLCVESSVMHLANALCVPSICVYKDFRQAALYPNCGKGFVRPTPAEVQIALDDLIAGKI